MAIKYLAGERLQGTAAERAVLTADTSAISDTGLRFLYKFDEASGNVINYGSVASADLTVSGLTRDVATPSGIGNGMSAPSNDSRDYAENTSRVNDYKFMHDGTAKWSVTFWAYLTATPGSSSNTETFALGNIWTDDNGIGFTIRWAYGGSSSTCRLQTFIADGDAGMPLNDQTGDDFMPELNAWHFYCVTYDPDVGSNHLTVTRDAVASGTSAQGFHQGAGNEVGSYSSSNPTRKVTYFARPTASYDIGMAGRLAQVMIFEDRILTQAEKVILYASGNGTTMYTPTVCNLSNGTIYEESDTGKFYMFDGSQTWNEMT